MPKIRILLLGLCLQALVCHAQNLTVTKFAPTMEAVTVPMQQKDRNGNICALVKVVLPVHDCQFEGNVVVTKFVTNEYWVYLTPGSKMLNVKCPSLRPLFVKFADYGVESVEEKRMYVLDLEGWEKVAVTPEPAVIGKTQEESLAQMRKIIEAAKLLGAEDIGPFMNGIAPIKKGDKYAFINKDGKQLTAFAFDKYLTPYYLTERIWIVLKNNLQGVLNSEGRLIADCKYKHISYANGKIELCEKVKTSYGGNILSSDLAKAKYDVVEAETGILLASNISWNEAKLILYPDQQYPRKEGADKLVDRDGRPAFNIKFDFVYPFSEGVACVKLKGKKNYTLIDINGDVLAQLPEGMFPVDSYSGKSDGCMHDGLLAVRQNGSSGYIDRNGNIVIPLRYADVGSFSEGIAAVSDGNYTNRRVYYIDTKGNIAFTPSEIQQDFTKCKNGMVVCRSGNMNRVFNKEGKMLYQGSGERITHLEWYGNECFEYGWLPVSGRKSDGSKFYYYLNADLKRPLPNVFSYAGYFFDEFTDVSDENGHGLIDSFGNIVYL